MRTTYNEILNSMKTTFFNECGENVDTLGDLGARFEAVASELFSISCFGDFILKQAFPQTAGGEYLDYHAGLRGIRRKVPAKAKGVLTFSVLSPSANDIEIPAGTICAMKDAPFIQFSTDYTETIPAGSLSVTVDATAIFQGADYNAPPSTVTVMVNPPVGVTSVNNRYSFSGGYDGESDAKLRSRILDAYKVPQKGLSLEMLKNTVNDVDEVLDCNIVKGSGNFVNIYVRCRGNDVTQELARIIDDKLLILELMNMNTYVYSAIAKKCDISIEVSAHDEPTQEIIDIVKEQIEGVHIGDSLNLNLLVGAICAIDGVNYCFVSSSATSSGTIACEKDEYISLSGIEVIYVD